MKKILSRVGVCLLLMSALLTSCSKDQVVEIDLSKIPNASFSFVFSSFEVANGDILKVTASVDEEKSSKGLEIKKVQYFWDDQPIETKTAAPFTLSYKIENQSIGKHILRVKVRYGGDGYMEIETDEGFKYEINVVERQEDSGGDNPTPSEPVYNIGVNFNSSARWVSNGETYQVNRIALSDENVNQGLSINHVTYYIDGKEIGSSYVDPYSFSYLVQDLQVGVHEFGYDVYIEGDNYSSVSSQKRDLYVLAAPLNVDLQIEYEGKDFFHDGVSNGEVFAGTISLVDDVSPADAQLKEVSFYWDDQLFATSKSAPFKFNYTISDQTVGLHFFTADYTVSSSVGEIKYKNIQSIRVLE